MSDQIPESVRQILRDLTDPDPCHFDHHGGCQAHGFLEPDPGEECPHAKSKRLLADSEDAGDVLPGCTGSGDCEAPAHQHGCFADTLAHCNEPEEHPAAPSAMYAAIRTLQDYANRLNAKSRHTPACQIRDAVDVITVIRRHEGEATG